MANILLISGSNLELLGEREPEIYGTTTLVELVEIATKTAESLGHSLEHFSTNAEDEIVGKVAEARKSFDAIIINPGAITHYGWSLHDALAAFENPIVELHLSNPHAREEWRKTSVVSPVASGIISGFGADGYRMAIEAVDGLLKKAIQ